MLSEIKQLEAFNAIITKPKNIRKHLRTDKKFVEWLRSGTVEDMQHTLVAFGDAGMNYECNLIIKVIELKIKYEKRNSASN